MTQIDLISAGSAILSACGRYRYALARGLPVFGGKPHGRTVCWLMLNPSTADGEQDDPTMRKVLGFSRRWGYERILVVNLFAWRSTDPGGLLTAEDPVGPENDRHILASADIAEVVVCAWGSNIGSLFPPRGTPHPGGGVRVSRACTDRRVAVIDLLKPYAEKLRAIKFNNSGEPAHPLMLSYVHPLRPFP